MLTFTVYHSDADSYHCMAGRWVTILSATILFCSAFQPPDARELMLTVALTTMCNHAYASIYFAICAGMRWRNGTGHNVAGAIQLCNLFSSMNLLFAGVFVPYKDMPTWCQWAYFISPAQYTFTAAFRAVASGVDLGPLPTDTGRYPTGYTITVMRTSTCP